MDIQLTPQQKQCIRQLNRDAVYEQADDLDRAENFVAETIDRLKADLKYMQSDELPAWFKAMYNTLQSIPLSFVWSENQLRFIDDAQEAGLEWFYYSGRGMYGDLCPAVRDEVKTTANCQQDSLGMGTVYYAQH